MTMPCVSDQEVTHYEKREQVLYQSILDTGKNRYSIKRLDIGLTLLIQFTCNCICTK